MDNEKRRQGKEKKQVAESSAQASKKESLLAFHMFKVEANRKSSTKNTCLQVLGDQMPAE